MAMEYWASLDEQPRRVENGRLVYDDGFSAEKAARGALLMTESCGRRGGRGGQVTLVLPYKGKDGNQLKLTVNPGEELQALIQRINDELKALEPKKGVCTSFCGQR
jgi:hypothetical protein